MQTMEIGYPPLEGQHKRKHSLIGQKYYGNVKKKAQSFCNHIAANVAVSLNKQLLFNLSFFHFQNSIF